MCYAAIAMPPEREAPRESAFVYYAKYGAIAYEFFGCIAAGVFLGYWLDRWLGTDPWLVLGMTIAGTAIGFYRMVQVLQRFERNR